MKSPGAIGLSFALVLLSALTGQANTTILEDETSWTGALTAQNLPTTSAWYASGASTLSVNGNSSLGASIGTGSTSASWWTYFTGAGSPVSLAPGEAIVVIVNFNLSGGTVGAQNTSRNFRFGLFDSSENGATRTTASGGSPAGANVTGYAQFANFGLTLGAANALQTQKRTTVADNNLLSASGDYTAVGSNGGGNASGATGYNNSDPYQLFFMVTNGGPAVSITTSLKDLNGGLSLSQTVIDSSGIYTNFDTFSLRPSGGASTASIFNFTEFTVEKTTFDAVPEPSALAVTGLGMFCLVRRFRRR